MEPYSYDLFASANIPALIWGAVIFLAAAAIGGLTLIPLGRRDFLAWLAFVLCAAVGGLKVTTENAWFAARPSGTEDVYKIYAESMKGADHLAQVQAAAKDLVSGVLKAN